MEAHFRIDKEKSNIANGVIVGTFMVDAGAMPLGEALHALFLEDVAKGLESSLNAPEPFKGFDASAIANMSEEEVVANGLCSCDLCCAPFEEEGEK